MAWRKVVAVMLSEAVLLSLGWVLVLLQARRMPMSETFLQARWPVAFRSAFFSPDSKLLATLDQRSGIAIWDVATGDLIRTFSDLGGGPLVHRDIWLDERRMRYLAFSHDSAMVALASGTDLNDHTDSGAAAVTVWNIADGEQVYRLPTRCLIDPEGGSYGRLEEVFDLRFSPGGSRIWVLGAFRRGIEHELIAVLWKPSKGDCFISRFAPLEPAWRDAVEAVFDAPPDESTNLRVAVANSAGQVQVWAVQHGAWERVSEVAPPSGGESRRILLLAAPAGGDRLVVEREHSPYSGTSDVEFWHLDKGKTARLTRVAQSAWLKSLSPNGTLVALAAGVAGTEAVSVEAFDTDRPKFRIMRLSCFWGSAEFSPDGRSLAVIEDGGESAKIFDQRTGSLRRVIDARRSSPVRSVQFSHDGRILAAGDDLGRVSLWDPTDGKLLGIIQAGEGRGPAAALAFSPDDRVLVTAASDSHIRLWDLAGGRASLRQSLPGRATLLAFSPGGDLLLSAHSTEDPMFARRVTLWSTARWEEVGHLERGSGTRTYSIAFSQDGGTLVTTEEDLMVAALWNMRTRSLHGFIWTGGFIPRGEELPVFVGNGDSFSGRRLDLPGLSAAFSPDGAILAVGTAGHMLLHAAQTGRLIAVACCANFRSIAFSPDGGTIATADDVRGLRLWPTISVDSGHPKPSYRDLGHQVDARAIAFAPDGKTLASGGTDGLVSLWDTRNSSLVMNLAHLSNEEWVAFRPMQLYYCGSDGADEWMRLRIAGTIAPVVPVQQFRHLLKQPDLAKVLTAPRPEVHLTASVLVWAVWAHIPNATSCAVGLLALLMFPYVVILLRVWRSSRTPS